MENHLKLISVIVPVYNIERYLPKCLDSVQNQTYKNLEVILVNDGSTDNSGKICDDYAIRDKRIKVVHKNNGGLVSARNTGLDIAVGDFVSFIDGDDYIEYETYEETIKILIQNKVDIVKYGVNRIEIDGSITKINSKFKAKKYEGAEKILLLKCIIKNEGIDNSISNCIFKKTIIDKYFVKTPKEIVQGEDLFFITKYLLYAQSMFFVPNLNYYNYVQNPSSLTKKYTNKYVYEIVILICRFLNLIENTEHKQICLEAFSYRINKLIFYVLFLQADFKFSAIKEKIKDLKYLSQNIPISNKIRNRYIIGVKAIPVVLFNAGCFFCALLVTWVFKIVYLLYKKVSH